MTSECRDELISAALDAEPVDVIALREALTSAGGRDTLVSFVLLRAAVAADTAMPGTDLAAHVAAARHPQRHRRVVPSWRVPVGIAASIAVLLAAGSFWAGTSWPARSANPPTAQAGPSSGAAAPSSAPASASAPRPADDDAPPIPARVLRFTPGVDWHEGS
jgi:negative regulator of sigma E activity